MQILMQNYFVQNNSKNVLNTASGQFWVKGLNYFICGSLGIANEPAVWARQCVFANDLRTLRLLLQ